MNPDRIAPMQSSFAKVRPIAPQVRPLHGVLSQVMVEAQADAARKPA